MKLGFNAWIWGVVPWFFLLLACPDPGTDGSNGEPLPEGEKCQPGELYECPVEGAEEALFCGDDGASLVLGSCPGPRGACRQGTCMIKPEGAICYPDEIQGCIVEGGKEAKVCNASQTAFVEGVCRGDDGRESLCVGGACTRCFPGARKCQGDQEVLECDDDGGGWSVVETCEGPSEVCTGRTCEDLCERSIKSKSYIGCDYFAVDLDNAFVQGGPEGYYDAQGAQFAVVVANPPGATLSAKIQVFIREGDTIEEVLYDSDGGLFPAEPLGPGELRTYRLPSRDVDGTVLSPLAYRISASAPIIAYQFNPLANENVFSNDASLLLPDALLGQEYFVMTREQTFANLRGYLTVVGVAPGETEVAVTVSAHTQPGVANGWDPLRREEIPHMRPGDTRIFTLRQYDVLNIETDRPGADLTGSYIVSNKNIAVFGGSEAANAPNTARCIDQDPITGEGICEWDGKTPCTTLLDCVDAGFNTCCADHLEQQIFPLKTWGSHYIASKSWPRGLSQDIYRIMAAEDGTVLQLSPPQPGVSLPVLNRGEYVEFESSGSFEIFAEDDKPILVGQFLAAEDAPGPNVGGRPGEGDAGIGDPAFMLLVPVVQYRTDFVVLTPTEYAENYINITLPTGAYLVVNGEEISPTELHPIGGGEYSYYRSPVPPGAHTIESDSPAGVIVYGWDSYVSYAYTGGMDLQEIRPEIVFEGQQ